MLFAGHGVRMATLWATAAGNGGLNHKLFSRVPDFMPSVRVRENEPFDVAMRRFKRSCEKAGILSEIRRREFYEKPTAERKRKAAAAVKRHLKKLQREAARRERLY